MSSMMGTTGIISYREWKQSVKSYPVTQLWLWLWFMICIREEVTQSH